MFKGSVRFSLVSTMSTMLALGLTLEQVVPMVTSNAAAMIGLQGEIGTLRPGAVADVTVLSDERGRWVMRDNENTQVVAERMLCPRLCLRAGQRVDADAAILPIAHAA
jgi:dihydroorotase